MKEVIFVVKEIQMTMLFHWELEMKEMVDMKCAWQHFNLCLLFQQDLLYAGKQTSKYDACEWMNESLFPLKSYNFYQWENWSHLYENTCDKMNMKSHISNE